MPTKPYIIALEEHYHDPEVRAKFEGFDRGLPPGIRARLDDLGASRLADMDAAGIDVQVLSHAAPSVQRMEPDIAVALARAANDRLADTVRAHPSRYQGFAALPTTDPQAAAAELERAVVTLGFKGAMIHGLSAGNLFHDDKRFWPIYERAQALDVPIYLHPAWPHPAVVEAYYKDYVREWPTFPIEGWGFAVETATQGLRMVLSRVFDTYPGLKIILGHLGEGLPFHLWRINHSLSRFSKQADYVRDTFREHFWVTTSGFFSDPALQCCIAELGIDHVMFSVDYPYVENQPGANWIDAVPLADADKVKLMSGNAKRLLKM
jgi:predicted TIM-barrel fold metal-dependent hydrolase